MREIKFRAKIKNNDNIFDVTTIDFGNCVVCIVDPERGNQEAFDWSEIESLLQFTGLHDKNGKEIYEGDIIKWHSLVLGDFHDVIDQIYFVDGAFKHGTVVTLCDMEMELCEVIGNIYENPELLEER